jgi:CRISPR-associated protein Cmr2
VLPLMIEFMTTAPIYTAVTFAPVQGFIEKSRKLRDLYGSSYLLSFLAQAVCLRAERLGLVVVSPAEVNIAQGLPNQIIVRGDLSREEAIASFMESWRWVVDGCQEWIEGEFEGTFKFEWNREWNQWAEHAWEVFWVQGAEGETVSQVRQRLNEAKRSRGWTAINWQGESSTLSGADAVAWYGMGQMLEKKQKGTLVLRKDADGKTAVEHFYGALSERLGLRFAERHARLSVARAKEFGESFVTPNEELSIPELVKRLVTHSAIVKSLIDRDVRAQKPPHLRELKDMVERDFEQVREDLDVESFQKMNRWEETCWTGWFMGDGDGASDYLKWVGQQSSESEGKCTQVFSRGMRDWGAEFKENLDHRSVPHGRVIYAGGDDFLGVMYRTDDRLSPKTCLQWLSGFKSQVWDGLVPWKGEHGKITASVGFVWASPQVPQRDVLQHARSAESSAKKSGKDRVAIRVLFAGGNHLEWVCPWRILEEGLFEKYRDRNGVMNALNNASWTHFYNDVAVLESRHAFGATMKESTEVAIALMQVYFPDLQNLMSDHNYWNKKYKPYEYKVTRAGILGDSKNYLEEGILNVEKMNQSINEWVINLAKVGFYLCSNT